MGSKFRVISRHPVFELAKMIVVYLVVTAAALALFDIAYFIRLVISGILYSLKWNQQPPILEESLINGM